MKILFYCSVIFSLLLFFACSSNGASQENTNNTANVANNSVAKNISVAEFEAMRKQNNNLQILDVRTPKEVAAGKIEGSVAMDFYGDNFKSQIEGLDRNQATLVYCKSGGRSGKTMKMMKRLGFTEVYNLKGGYTAYSKQ